MSGLSALRHLLFLVAACAILAACSEPARHPALVGAQLPELIPAHRFAYRGTLTGGYSLSPDGNKIAWVGPSFMRATLFVRNHSTGEVRSWRARGNVQWTADSRRLVYLSDTSGSENAHVFMIDTESGSAAVDLTPYPGVRAAIQKSNESEPTRLMVTHNRRNPKLFDLYSIDLDTRAETLVARNPGDAVAPIVLDNGAFRGWQQSREARRTPEEVRTPQAERAPALASRDEGTVRLLGQSPEPRVMWALSNRGRDRMALVTLHLGPGWEHLAFEDAVADVSTAAISRVTHLPLMVSALPGYPRIEFPDQRFKADLEPLLKGYAGRPFDLELLGSDRAEKRMIVAIHTSTGSETFLLDREQGSHELLSRGVPAEIEAALAPLEPVSIAARDGLTLRGYLSVPRGVAPKGLPLVLMVHGGPWARTAWADPFRSDDSSRAQFLVNRGYAVLQVDFRGSTGYGRSFYKAGMGEFGRRMQDDLQDAVEWAKARGLADPRKIAIMGFSYGGYAALTGLTATPKTFACGISIGGPTDLATLIERFPAHWQVDLSNWHDFVGNPKVPADRAEMTRRSPLTHAAQAERPLLIIHGRRDVRVGIDQSERMVAALNAAGRPVRFVDIADMGHNPSWWAHQHQVLRETEVFLQQCLGGRATRLSWFDPLVWIWSRLSR